MSESCADLPLGWAFRTLEQIAAKVTSGATPTSGSSRFYVENGGLPFAKTEDLTRARSKFIDNCELAVSDAALRETAVKRYPAGTILVSMYGTIGLTKIAAVPMAANQALCALIPPFACHPGYLFHHLDYVREGWTRYSGQTTQANINGATVKTHAVPLPPLEQQVKIAEILDTCDAVIQKTEALIDNLKAIKQGLLHDLLTRGIDANGRLRPPRAEAPHLYKESSLGWIPKDWDLGGLAKVASSHRAVIRTGPFGSSLKGEHWREGGTPVVTIGSLGDGAFIPSELLFVDEATAVRLADFSLVPGDLVFSRVADVGRSVVVSENERGWIMSSNFMRISCDRERARPEFVQALLSSSHLVRRQLRTMVNSGGRDVANSSILLGLCFLWPSLAEQDIILSRVRAIDELLKAEGVGLQKQLIAKSALMDDLLTGRVRVTPLLAKQPTERSA